ncbi:hypothetical protein AVEN_33464-1 [Araneus ventricosus]|uniref:Uncharacterized protein n=1 Tax=Araneus ventricosus TaxID=182803 RepID=A0A4Y2JI16_ARAVE|nr:hypothetical protein AVEN_33464-1 [Araneus ventricosus]
MDLVILNRRHLWMTSELAPPFPISAPHQREGVWPLRMSQRAAGPTHGESSVESGFEPATLRSRGRDLTTRPPRPTEGEGLVIKTQMESWITLLQTIFAHFQQLS